MQAIAPVVPEGFQIQDRGSSPARFVIHPCYRLLQAGSASDKWFPASNQSDLVFGQGDLASAQRGVAFSQRGLVPAQRGLVSAQRDFVNPLACFARTRGHVCHPACAQVFRRCRIQRRVFVFVVFVVFVVFCCMVHWWPGLYCWNIETLHNTQVREGRWWRAVHLRHEKVESSTLYQRPCSQKYATTWPPLTKVVVAPYLSANYAT